MEDRRAGGGPDVRIADFDADNTAIRRIRFAVFVDEQKVPEEIEIDDRDPVCTHVLAWVDGEAVATGRVDVAGDTAGKVGRVAVLPEARRRGVGSAVMRALHAIARERGLGAVWCHAQVSAAAFYERLGYGIASAPFDEAGIAHVRMELDLDLPPAPPDSLPADGPAG